MDAEREAARKERETAVQRIAELTTDRHKLRASTGPRVMASPVASGPAIVVPAVVTSTGGAWLLDTTR